MEEEVFNEVKTLDNPTVGMCTSRRVIVEAKILLPTLNIDELLDRYERIKPIVKFGPFYYRLRDFDQMELTSLSFMDKLYNTHSGDVREIISPRKIETLGDFPCYHTIGKNGDFSPKIAEVLSQFPNEYLEESNGFYLYNYPKTKEDFENQSEIIEAGCHKSRVKALRINKK